MARAKELLIPAAALEDPEVFEVLRVWVAKQGQHVSLDPGIWDDPFVWGMVLADLAGHIANAYEQMAGLDRADVLKRIKAGLDAELASPTDVPRGTVAEDGTAH
jgi:hypothetical protein